MRGRRPPALPPRRPAVVRLAHPALPVCPPIDWSCTSWAAAPPTPWTCWPVRCAGPPGGGVRPPVTPLQQGRRCPHAWRRTGVEGTAVLCDTDIAVVEDPRVLTVPEDGLAAKVVDAPVPPLDVLDRVFAAAGVPVPGIVDLPWGPGERTVEGNANGGLYLVPGTQLGAVARGWARWARWLLERTELLESWAVHVDQVAMALTLAAEGIGFHRPGAPLEHPHPRPLPHPVGRRRRPPSSTTTRSSVSTGGSVRPGPRPSTRSSSGSTAPSARCGSRPSRTPPSGSGATSPTRTWVRGSGAGASRSVPSGSC